MKKAHDGLNYGLIKRAVGGDFHVIAVIRDLYDGSVIYHRCAYLI